MMSQIDVVAVREDRGRFAKLEDKRVLIYWPHGFGDWVHLGTIAPLLEPSNRYAVTRFGDDYVSLMEGCRGVTPLYSGERTPNDGGALGAAHLGIRLGDCNGRRIAIAIPPPLDAAVGRFSPDTLLWTDYPETEGSTAFPFHTKARNLVRLLVDPARLGALDLSLPLKNAIDFVASANVQRMVDERLMQFAPPGTRLCVISRTGVTASRKNWGNADEAMAFVSMLRAGSGGWRFLSMDDDELGESSTGYRRLFASLEPPFAWLFKALAARMELFVGIPAGPLHFVLARGGIPTVGLWLAHHPDWYDEPNPNAVHVLGNYIRERRFDRRPATVTKPPTLAHKIRFVDSRAIAARDVVAAAEEAMR